MVKLADIDSKTFARSITDRVLHFHSWGLLTAIGPAAEPSPRIEGLGNVGLAALVLCHYAQTGEEPGDAPIAEYLQSYCEALYTRAGDAGSYDVPPLDQARGEPQHEHELVLLAAVGRDLLSAGSPVSLLQLAAISDTPYQSVRRLAASGEIAREPRSPVPAEEARRWLASRGVAGFREEVTAG